jgi:hypothetical protein
MRSLSALAVSAAATKAELVALAAVKPLFDRIWPPAVIALGLGLTVAWVSSWATGLLVWWPSQSESRKNRL